jgi:chromosome segregation ATPase
LINYWNSHKQILEEKIRRLTNEINQLKKYKNADIQISQYNENILQAKREMNKLQMEITDQNTTIYNLYKKIECLEQALMISKQRTNAQLNEIEVN